jgi:calcium-dependent protein kinase
LKHSEFRQVSDLAKDLITKLIVVDAAKRYSANEALQHPWFQQNIPKQEAMSIDFETNLIKRLKEYKGVSHLKRAAMHLLVKMSNEDDISQTTELFRFIDIDGTGMIDLHELTKYMETKD